MLQENSSIIHLSAALSQVFLGIQIIAIVFSDRCSFPKQDNRGVPQGIVLSTTPFISCMIEHLSELKKKKNSNITT